MRKPTFEQAMRLTLGNLNITKVIDDEYPIELWQAAYLADKKDVDTFLDVFCEDMSFLANRPISRASYLDGTFNLFGLRPRMPRDLMPSIVKDCYTKTIKVMDRYINEVIDNMQCIKTNDITMKPFPFSKIKRLTKKVISANLPSANEEVTQILLKDPTSKSIDDVQKPKHIVELLDKLKQTHYDYQPYILDDEAEKLLVIRLGNDWNDIAIARWKPQPLVKIDTFLMALVFLLFSLGTFGLWFNGFAADKVSEIVIMILSILSCVGSAFFTGLFIVRNNKSFKV